MYIQDTLSPYRVIEYDGIQYTTCRDFSNISPYKGLRQVVHNPNTPERLMALETPNSFSSHAEVIYHIVTLPEENRLDIIANKYLGSAQYAWVIAYFNQIEDGYTCREGQRLAIPKNLTSLYCTGEILAPIPALHLNLGSE